MQPGFDCTNRYAGKLLYFRHFIAFCVVQEHDYTVFIAQLSQRGVQLLNGLVTAMVVSRVVRAGQARNAIAGELPLFDGKHAATRKTALLVNEQVVHNAAQPRSGRVLCYKVVQLAERLDQQFLKQVFGLCPGTRQAPRETIQAVEVRSYQTLESPGLVGVTHK